MKNQAIINWLLEGDVSIQFQVYRDLIGEERPDLQQRIATEGWGAEFLAQRKPAGHWGKRFYEPKWISSHYTLLDLRNLCISPDNAIIRDSLQKIVAKDKGPDGGINPIGMVQKSDVCVNGMFLNYATYFKTPASDLNSVVDCLLQECMADGGFNCRSNRSGARHSSLHSTLSVIEGFTEYLKNGYTYRAAEMEASITSSIEFILLHQLFISDRTGEIINKDFLKFPYPSRWKYDVLRALDYFQYANIPWDDRLKPALDILLKKRTKDGTWKLNAKYPGKLHIEMEKAGKASRWNTLRAMRVLKKYGEKVANM
jgi:hypothetical protein